VKWDHLKHGAASAGLAVIGGKIQQQKQTWDLQKKRPRVMNRCVPLAAARHTATAMSPKTTLFLTGRARVLRNLDENVCELPHAIILSCRC